MLTMMLNGIQKLQSSTYFIESNRELEADLDDDAFVIGPT